MTINDVNKGKVKLQFGNPEHIKLAKEAEKEANVKKFKVSFEIWDTAEITVEANNKQEAEEIANDELSLDDFDIINVEVSEKANT